VEAMACGTPVIASNLSSLPEVVGEAGLLVDAWDVDALRQAMTLRNSCWAKSGLKPRLFI